MRLIPEQAEWQLPNKWSQEDMAEVKWGPINKGTCSKGKLQKMQGRGGRASGRLPALPFEGLLISSGAAVWGATSQERTGRGLCPVQCQCWHGSWAQGSLDSSIHPASAEGMETLTVEVWPVNSPKRASDCLEARKWTECSKRGESSQALLSVWNLRPFYYSMGWQLLFNSFYRWGNRGLKEITLQVPLSIACWGHMFRFFKLQISRAVW